MDERSFFLLAYDIADDRRRLKIALLMESLGERVQGSVFEAYLKPAELEKLVRKAGRVMKAEEDSLRIYALCRACRTRIRTVGSARVTPPPQVQVI